MDKPKTDTSIQVLFSQGVSDVTLSQTVAAFLRVEMAGQSELTLRWYRRRLNSLCAALGESRSLADIQEADLAEWRSAMASRGLSVYTFHGHLRACKRLFKWLYVRGILAADLAAHLKLPRLPRQGRKGIAEEDLRMILAAARSNPRDYAMLMFLASTGARRAGVANLLLADLNLSDEDGRLRRRVLVHEKGGKERVVMLTPGALAALMAWLEVRPSIDDDHVFLGRRPGEPWHALTPDGVSEVIARYTRRLGLTGKTSPHQWRHWRCRKWLQEGLDLSSVSRLAGHEDPALTIRFYGGFDVDQLQQAYDQHTEEL